MKLAFGVVCLLFFLLFSRFWISSIPFDWCFTASGFRVLRLLAAYAVILL
jgi:hypothetical protein